MVYAVALPLESSAGEYRSEVLMKAPFFVTGLVPVAFEKELHVMVSLAECRWWSAVEPPPRKVAVALAKSPVLPPR